ncbi:MAG TPA: hypothetical protein VK335_08490 [Bryobacteraceae bacterium]|nr:hypothetical protein [Bryobacteraceae bacterium]
MFTSTLASSLPKCPFALFSFDQHIIGVGVAFLPPLPQPAVACPIVLFPAMHHFGNLEIHPASGFFDYNLEMFQEFAAEEWELLEALEIGQDLLEILVERVEGFVDPEFLGIHYSHLRTSR